ncbi:YtxH domain-containing protein [Bacillus solimangrovi]|uniref:YtxH domain-containing protein n=1 Tax=Bacillus solimangrovi TaxID=1305675 RepID=A0A1E5LB69_9BACI|nr:YtxH domain-containing protein [Bacillus solimangrovi]OEH91327.1 hypothetical protein BFG57_05535 [Bacillus solimangrovi]
MGDNQVYDEKKGQNKLIHGMLIGAVVGAAVTLFDRDTRDYTVTRLKKCGSTTWNCVKNPSQTVENVSNTVSSMQKRTKVLAEDATFFVEKFKEIAETTPEVVEAVRKTKKHVTEFSEGAEHK